VIPKRAAVLRVLRESEGHLQADEIYRRVRQVYPGIVLATVYNNLHALTEAGLIRRIPTPTGADFYDKTPRCTSMRFARSVADSLMPSWVILLPFCSVIWQCPFFPTT